MFSDINGPQRCRRNSQLCTYRSSAALKVNQSWTLYDSSTHCRRMQSLKCVLCGPRLFVREMKRVRPGLKAVRLLPVATADRRQRSWRQDACTQPPSGKPIPDKPSERSDHAHAFREEYSRLYRLRPGISSGDVNVTEMLLYLMDVRDSQLISTCSPLVLLRTQTIMTGSGASSSQSNCPHLGLKGVPG
ncbi:hypothetical protein DPX16_14317 [Anabarilius grahami]|uniref:Uncharacterized protein n=1 Tax=Anabarilius grahami TaxID=495550 RepID=A0A3N0XMQ9_ANAGA|nr:hypothetical protein DPX16_14317 [Anabarilius grahami]